MTNPLRSPDPDEHRPPRSPSRRTGRPGAAPSSPPSGFAAWLELMRLSNAPTVATNALVGGAIAMLWQRSGRATSDATATSDGAALPATLSAAIPAGPRPMEVALLVLAMVAMYTAGMILNDWFDLEVDRRERPRRPLPSGRIGAASALNVAIVLLGGGAIVACAVNRAALPWVLLLAAAIVAYDRMHARAWAGIPLMALCRMLAIAVPALALSAMGDAPWRLLAWFAIPLGVYVALVSVIARREAAAPSVGRWAGLLLIVPALAPIAALSSGLLPPLTSGRVLGIGFISGALVAWLVRAQLFATPLPAAIVARMLPRRLPPGGVRVPRAVMAWLAAISLVDAMSLLLLDQPGLAVVAMGCFFVTSVSHTRVAGS